ncbi:MAG: hypothetical protein WD025_00470 [Bacteriovoracaceae bacterium]
MELVKDTENYAIYKKRNGRYAVKGPNKKWINKDEKAQILSKEGLIKLSKPSEKPAEEAAPESEGAEATAAKEE